MEKERVKLDEVLKFLFSTSHQVLVKLLNGIFDEDFKIEEVELAVSNSKLAYEAKQLFEEDEILGEDFHKLLLAIQNLIEYMNRNYFNNQEIEDEVSRMTKTLYDPEVERRGIKKGIEQGIEQGIEKGIEKGIEQGKRQAAKALLDLLDDETIATRIGLTIEEVKALRK